MLTLPNFLSLLRFPLAFLFLKQNVGIRITAIVLAMFSDGLDGYIARRFHSASKLGTLLDPIMDRFFVYFVMGVFLFEQKIDYWQAGALACRDIAVVLFGFYLVLTDKLSSFRFRAIWCGKVTTTLQFFFYLGITFGVVIPSYVYGIFALLGVLALVELYLSKAEAASV